MENAVPINNMGASKAKARGVGIVFDKNRVPKGDMSRISVLEAEVADQITAAQKEEAHSHIALFTSTPIKHLKGSISLEVPMHCYPANPTAFLDHIIEDESKAK